MQRQMHLGYISQIVGSHVGGWRIPGANSETERFELLARTVSAAERGKLDFVFFADSVYTGPDVVREQIVRLEPLTLLGALSAVTERIGLVATVSTTYSGAVQCRASVGVARSYQPGANWLECRYERIAPGGCGELFHQQASAA